MNKTDSGLDDKDESGRATVKRRNHSLSTRWLVFYTMARAEKKCEDRLQDQGVEVFVPKCKVVRQWKDRKKKVTVSLFPNYLFANVDEYDRLKVLQTNGIVRMITFGGQPAEMTGEEIEQLRITQNAPELLETLSQSRVPVGTPVKIEDGPMAGLRGKVVEHRGESYLVVEVHSIKQAVKVNVPDAMVRSLEE